MCECVYVCVYVYVCMYVCMCECMRVCVCGVCMHVCICCVYVCMYVRMCCVNTCMYVCGVCIRVCVCACVCVCTNVCVQFFHVILTPLHFLTSDFDVKIVSLLSGIGATTGTGGRIRDNQATGRGAHVIAGTAGYCVFHCNALRLFYVIGYHSTLYIS